MAVILFMSSIPKPPGRELARTLLSPSLSSDSDLHFLVYAVLAVTLIWALWPNFISAWPSFVLAWFLSSVYGAIDVCHQAFVPGRAGSLGDFATDSLGALVSCLLAGGLYLLALKVKRKAPATDLRASGADDSTLRSGDS